MKLFIREMQKAILQYVILPFAYWIFCYQKIDENLVVFADSRDEEINYNSYSMYNEVKKRGYNVELYLYNFDQLSMLQKLWKSIMFMKLYARAKYVFIYNYYLPASSCNKRKETKLIQIWHSSGLQKKFGYDSLEDLGAYKLIQPTKNYDLVSVSSEEVKKVFEKAWKLKPEKVQAFGSSRTDLLFNKEFQEAARKEFFDKYPEAIGKKIVLWAPSYRGLDVDANINIFEDIALLRESLPQEYYLIIKLHPHLKEKDKVDNCDMPTEKLLVFVDILITDYSSIFFDYLLFGNQCVFYVPDYDEYVNNRGMYIDYFTEFSFPVVKNIKDLVCSVKNCRPVDISKIEKYRNKFVSQNNGTVTNKILKKLV